MKDIREIDRSKVPNSPPGIMDMVMKDLVPSFNALVEHVRKQEARLSVLEGLAPATPPQAPAPPPAADEAPKATEEVKPLQAAGTTTHEVLGDELATLLSNAGYTTIEAINQASDSELIRQVKGYGKAALQETRAKIAEAGLTPAPSG